MKISTQTVTTHSLALSPHEWFFVKLTDRVISVDGIDAVQRAEGEGWKIILYGNRVLNSGAFGKRQRAETWEHTRSFSQASRQALWAVLSDEVKAELTTLGVSV